MVLNRESSSTRFPHYTVLKTTKKNLTEWALGNVCFSSSKVQNLSLVGSSSHKSYQLSLQKHIFFLLIKYLKVTLPKEPKTTKGPLEDLISFRRREFYLQYVHTVCFINLCHQGQGTAHNIYHCICFLKTTLIV